MTSYFRSLFWEPGQPHMHVSACVAVLAQGDDPLLAMIFFHTGVVFEVL